jgi:hypothetical protein
MKMTGGNIKDLTIDQIHRLMTVTQFVTDVCLNDIEVRDALTYHPSGYVVVPYVCDHGVETVLTRP